MIRLELIISQGLALAQLFSQDSERPWLHHMKQHVVLAVLLWRCCKNFSLLHTVYYRLPWAIGIHPKRSTV